MVKIPRMFRRLLVALLVASASSACAQPAKTAPVALPSEGLSEVTLYELLLAEIALQRGEAELAARTYLEVAKRTRDPRLARRTVEVASSARLNDVAIEAARLWEAMEPSSPQALQITAALLVADKRVDEALPYLERLLAAEGVNIESAFLQINRLLAANPDKAANLRVVRALVARHDALPQAHFALAQAASAAGDDDAGHAAVRRALALKPDWELAAVLQAQLLQKRSAGEAARSLAAFLEK
jgi:tetratricopeptide (TPR) repeat protein